MLGNTEAALQVSNDEAEILKAEIERLKRTKKDLESRLVEHADTLEKNQDLQTKLELVNAQLVLKGKAIRDL